MTLALGIVVLLVANAVAIGLMLAIRRGAAEGGYFAEQRPRLGGVRVPATGSTPQPFQPPCAFNPGLVPKAMDVVSGAASQATMLDYTIGPFVLAGVTLP